MQNGNMNMEEMTFADWNVKVTSGKGTVSDTSGNIVAKFDVNDEGHVTLTEGECKYADMALIAVRSHARYGAAQTA